MAEQQPPLESVVQKMIDAGEPEDNIAAVIQHYKTQTPATTGQVRSRTGQMYTPPTSEQVDKGPLAHFVGRLVSNVNPINLVHGAIETGRTLYNDFPTGVKNIAQGLASPITEAAQGNFPEAAADAFTMLALGMRGPKKLPTTLRGVPIADLKAAGVGEQSLNLMRQERPAPSQGVLRTTSAKPAPPTVGNLALKPEAAPVSAASTVPTGFKAPANTLDRMVMNQTRNEAFNRVAEKQNMAQPMATENAVAPKPKLSAPEVAQLLRQEYGSEQAGRMLYGKSNPQALAPAERTAAIKRLAPGESRLPNAAKRGIDQYLTNADPDAVKPPNQLASDYIADKGRQGFRSESGGISPLLLRELGLPFVKYPIAYHYGGWPGVGLMGAGDAARLGAAHPEMTGAMLRAALLAQMAGRPAADGSQ